MWNTHSSLFCFTSRLFATLCYRPVTLPAGGRRRQDGAMRAIKDQHRQRASLVSTDGAKVGQFPLPCKENELGWKLVKEKVKEVHFSPLLVKVRDSLVKVCWNLLWEFAERVVGFWREFAEVCQKNRMPPLRVPALDLQTAHQRNIDLQGIIQSGRNVIMSSCRNVIMPLRILQGNAVCGLKEIVYNIIYYFFEPTYSVSL